MISLAADAFRKARKSALAPPISSENPPLGLYALILVAVRYLSYFTLCPDLTTNVLNLD
jgi:hypothetical protein